MVLNEFDAYREALRKVDLSEAALPIYHGRLLVENADVYCKVQKLLACPGMERCHMWLYDLDVENLSESECRKVCNLYQLALDRGCFPGADDTEEAPVEELPAEPAPVPVAQPAQQKPKLPMAAYTVVYSATRGGEIKTGEAYSNAISTRAAKADVLAKLDRAGYQNVVILAIEAGDPDCSGCPDVEPTPEEDVDADAGLAMEADIREPMSHAFDPIGFKASTANTCGQDEARMLINEEDIKRAMRKAFDEASAEIDNSPTLAYGAKFIADHKTELQRLNKLLAGDEKAKSDLALICSSLTRGQVDLSESTGVSMVVRGLLKILLTAFKVMALGVGAGGKAITWMAKLLAAGADRCRDKLGEAEEDRSERLGEADGDDESGDSDSSGDADDGAADEDGEDEASDDSSDEEDDEAGEDEEAPEEDEVEPDEELKSDDDGEEASDDEVPSGEELSDAEKSQLKDSYKKAFKAAMVKCKFAGKNFDQLDLEQKTKFFTELSKAWGSKADPVKFMSQKETEALEQIVVKG